MCGFRHITTGGMRIFRTKPERETCADCGFESNGVYMEDIVRAKYVFPFVVGEVGGEERSVRTHTHTYTHQESIYIYIRFNDAHVRGILKRRIA